MSSRYELRIWQCPNQGLPIKSYMGAQVMYGIGRSGIVALQCDTYAIVSHMSAKDFAVIDNKEHRSYKNPVLLVIGDISNAINSAIPPIFCSWVYVFDTDEIVFRHASGAVLKAIKRGTQGFDVAFSSRDDKVYPPTEDRLFSADIVDNVMSAVEETTGLYESLAIKEASIDEILKK